METRDREGAINSDRGEVGRERRRRGREMER